MLSDTNFYPHFFYPTLLLLIPLWLLGLYGYHRIQQNKDTQKSNWDALVDKPLRPFVISGYKQREPQGHQNQQSKAIWLIALAGLIAILALSGPSLHKRQVPFYEDQQGLVIVLDLSASMLAQDLKPNRLQRAKFAIIDLLKQRKTGYAALVVFAGDAFTVSPLTNDVDTIFAQLTHMSPSIMPTQGSRLDKAIKQSIELLSNTGHYTGNILLVTDGLSNLSKSINAASLASDKGYEVSVLAMGTTTGTTIPLGMKGQVLLDTNGKPVIAALDIKALQAVVKAGKGMLLLSTGDESDISTLLNRYKTEKSFETRNKNTHEYWINAGVWLLLPLVFIVLLLFRRGLIWVLCLIVLFPANEVYAYFHFTVDSNNKDWSWESLWLNPQQQAKKILTAGGNIDATNPVKKRTINEAKAIAKDQVFVNNQWKAATAYRAEDYALAVKLYDQEDTADAFYNKGNALARMYHFKEAIEAYQTALKKQPTHNDAHFNLKLVRKRQEELSNATPKDNSSLEFKDLAHSSAENTVEHKMLQSSVQHPFSQEIARQAAQKKEQQAFDKQWLNSIPDDPSGLWRRKFSFQYKKQYKNQDATHNKKPFKQRHTEEQQW